MPKDGKKLFSIMAITISLIFLAFPPPSLAAYNPYGPISVERAKGMLSQLENPPEVVGIYDLVKGTYHGRFLLIPNKLDIRPEADFAALVIESPNKKEKSGNIKFFLTATESDNAFNVEYFDYGDLGTCAGKDKKGFYTPGQIQVFIMDLARFPPDAFFRTYSPHK